MNPFAWINRISQRAATPGRKSLSAETVPTVTAGPGAVAAGRDITGSAIGDNNTITHIEHHYTNTVEVSGFEQALATLPPLLQREARKLRSHWPDVETVVVQLPTGRTPRKDLLTQWAGHEPPWLGDADAQALAWLAELAGAYDARLASFSFFDLAVRKGGYPRDLLVVRAALQKEVMAEGSARTYLADHEDLDSPLVRALGSILDGDRSAALAQLGRWTAPDDGARALHLLLETDALVGQGLIDEALPALREADISIFPQVGLALAQTLLQRATRRDARRGLGDAQEALTVALRARNARRQWFGDSAAAVVLAMQAAQLSQDLSAAWNLSQLAPDGDADVHEAEDPRVLEQGAFVAAMTGREHRARELLDLVTNRFTQAQVLAVLEEFRVGEGGNERAAAAWKHAWEVAQPGPEQLMAAMGLVESGRGLPDIAHLRGDYPEAVADLERFARAVSGIADGDLSVLRANASQSPMLALKLAERYQHAGELDRAAATLQEAASHWRDARLMAAAARAYKRAMDYERAKECAESALRIAGPGWAAQSTMYALLVETESAAGRWEQATDAAIALLALDPHDLDARWALVKCYVTRTQPEAAWLTLTELGQPAQPRRRDEALLWVQLGARLSDDPQFFGRALELMQSWPQDEELLGQFLGVLHWRTTTSKALTPEAAELLYAASSDYLERFPESAYFQAIKASDPELALQELGERLRLEHKDENRREVRDRVKQGQLPVGMLALANHRSYAEVCVRLTAEPPGVLASDPAARVAESEAIELAQTRRVIVDTSAIVSLALLERGATDRLVGYCQSILTTDQIVGDVLHANESLSLRSELSVVWSPEESRAVIWAVPEEQVSALRRTVGRTTELARSLLRAAQPELRALPKLSSGRGTEVWLTALDHAKEHNLVLWCDDRVLRTLARSLGVPAFGTLALIDACQRERTAAPLEALTLKAELLRSYYMDIPFSTDLYSFAAQADGWKARGVACAVARPAAWTDAQAVVRLVLEAASHVVGSQPDHASVWLASAYVGLWRATLPSHRVSNMQKLCVQSLTQHWVSASSLPFLLEGLRNGATEVQSGDGPLVAALATYYGALVEQVGHPVAGTELMNLFSHATDADKSAAARIVLTHRDA
ncbi:hypothetical protein OG458_07175 [Streptomyces sp. NBC_01281]|uniref:PIN domain-containing protein n=1 Tax=Streptomyces sp. NBC_01281 TaxID=2903811 RepID=UPI002E12D2F2|nr:hypothetical protein OG458_07175 [Streptomyces sp. NBC_01281]